MLTINNTLDGYLKDVEILGNTMQDEEDLADIRSVGEKVEGQELYEIPVLSCGKNLLNIEDKVVTTHGVTFDYSNQIITLSGTSTQNYISSPVISVANVLQDGKCYRLSSVGTDVKVIATFRYTDETNTQQWADKVLWKSSYSKPFVYVQVQNNGTNCNGYKIKLQLEEVPNLGTVATPYEPYVEDKITILSPVQLEKVGDVRDRIICKDGVWGVEKNITDDVIGASSFGLNSGATGENTVLFNMYNASRFFSSNNRKVSVISDLFEGMSADEQWTSDVESIAININNTLLVRISKDKLTTLDTAGFSNWLDKNNISIKKFSNEPTFIPLPHDQQVKLRTFANKTNISFLTEIEGTIKAQVPKSLGATVNTHTEQISNLNKELDRVKKLEESTVSTVETESDFTTVEATSNGYFEDVKLEGKTLVNLATAHMVVGTGSATKYTFDGEYYSIQKTNGYTLGISFKSRNDLLEANKTYTIIINNKSEIQTFLYDTNYSKISTLSNGINIIKFTPSISQLIRVGDVGSVNSEGLIKFSIVLLEGDHTQNPPSYFEGLKSVGQDVDEIVVSSVNENLFNPSSCKYNTSIFDDGIESPSNSYVTSDFIRVESGLNYYVSGLSVVIGYDLNKNFIKIFKNTNVAGCITIPTNCSYIRIRNYNQLNTIDLQREVVNSTYLIKGTTPKPYTPHQADKKRLLFYNNETQTWEKPILRQWDSIEKHADGKYYYHQRSGEVVLNGSEDWKYTNSQNGENTLFFHITINTSKKHSSIICDTMKVSSTDLWVPSVDFESVFITDNHFLQFRINKSKLSTQDLEGFKQWLQTNNVTVVYQLTQEKVYECTNIDLITYANETNYIVESGAIAPRTTLKVHNNISNVVSLLQKKVSLLESNMTKYMITQNRMQLASTYSADSVTFKVDYALCSEEVEYNEDLYNLILNNILVGKDNYDYDKMFTMILDYASWNQISWEQFDILVGLMDIQHNPPIEEIPTDDEIVEEIPNEIM